MNSLGIVRKKSEVWQQNGLRNIVGTAQMEKAQIFWPYRSVGE